jgi:serine/threonine-protein kinase mTOR
MLLMNTAGASADEFYQTVTINALVNMLNDATLSNHHPLTIESFMMIFKTQGLKCVPYLPQVCEDLVHSDVVEF